MNFPLIACATIAKVNTTLKALIVWLMLLAVPLQGFAAATRLLCASPPSVGEQQLAGHETGRVLVLAADDSHGDHHHAATVNTSSHEGKHPLPHHHADAKCNTCATCCFGASMPASFASSLPVQAPQFESIPFIPRHIASAELALPERPPRA